MNRNLTPTILATLALSALLTACGKPEEQTAGQKLDETIAKTEQAGAEIKSDAQQMANQAGQALTDASITTKINAALAADDELKALQINVDTKDGRVVLTGTAPNANAQQRATMLAQAVEGVMAVDNRLVISQG
jgi:hyperosmotically inducible protein